ncbi:Uncharacterised protein [Legionella geestiana]|nr:Uncharacterised protein [Legionella geestiana]
MTPAKQPHVSVRIKKVVCHPGFCEGDEGEEGATRVSITIYR